MSPQTDPTLALPAAVDLRASLPPVRDQGNRGTCLAFAVTAAHEHARSGSSEVTVNLSEEALYWACKQVDGDRQAGTSFPSAAAVLAESGQPEEAWWPYDPGRGDDTTDAYQPPAPLASTRCYQVDLRPVTGDAASIQAELAAGRVVVLGLTLTEAFILAAEGEVPAPAADDVLLGGHAVLCAGYLTGPAGVRYLVRNSWGDGWGDHGYGTLPAAYIEQYCSDAWACFRPLAGT